MWSFVVSIWLVGAIIFIVKRLYRIVDFNQKIKSINVFDNRLISELDGAKKTANIYSDIKIAESLYVDIPLVYGLINPIILLPVGFADSISRKKLSCILLHELCHVKRRDMLKNYIWLIAKTVHWFNPFVHIAYRRYLDNVEELCDEMVLKYLNEQDKYEYTQSLLDVIRLSKNKCELPLTVSFCK